MANITAAEVNKLRQSTGAGMMDCKNALVEAEGDFDKAVSILRKKGQKVAANRADRDSSEGAVIAYVNDNNTEGVIISLNCETDFVAKNDAFVALATEFAAVAVNYNSKEDFLKERKELMKNVLFKSCLSATVSIFDVSELFSVSAVAATESTVAICEVATRLEIAFSETSEIGS